jgi:hypothetical protein
MGRVIAITATTTTGPIGVEPVEWQILPKAPAHQVLRRSHARPRLSLRCVQQSPTNFTITTAMKLGTSRIGI